MRIFPATLRRINMSTVSNKDKPAPRLEKGKAAGMVEEILDGLAAVESHMTKFRKYIKIQHDEEKPLYQWDSYTGYLGLKSAVAGLDGATTKFKRARLPQEYMSASVSRATESSTAVSKAASYILAAMNRKTANYMDEMETSTLSEEAKIHANAIITKELQKLMEHSTHATDRVWVATDLLRTLKDKQANYKDWAWSAAAVAMTASISAMMGILTAHLFGPTGFELGPSGRMYSQVIDLVQRTQAVTNLTGELYTIKLQDIDQRYTDLAALSNSHGDRIDSIVDALGPPNEEGTYYVSMPKSSGGESCKDVDNRLRKVSDDAARQMQRLQEEMRLMRKNVNRMDIRLTSGLNKCQKG
jgi:hypothetical protein